ncbi:MAG TPA: DNA translocase FtsK 4TM domain-containing protein [Bacteroidota bacterium]|nr:DNA translocase FtsK 4TM domain-containing protein [Bacteroidota bacterium]
MANQKENTEPLKSQRHKQQIGALCCLVVSLLLLISLVSYSPADQANGEISIFDLWKVVTNDEYILAKAEHTNNWLGLLGAIISNWLINGTIGYAVLIVPALGFLWGIYLFNRKNLHKKIHFTNYALSLGILFSTFTGALRYLDNALPMEWSGIIGHFLAYVLVNIIGLTGTFIVLFALFFILLTLLIDLDYRVSIARVQNGIITFKNYSQRLYQRLQKKSSNEEQIKVQKHQIDRDNISEKKKIEVEKTREEMPPAPITIAKSIPVEIKKSNVENQEPEAPIHHAYDKGELEYDFPPLKLLNEYPDDSEETEEEVEQNIELLRSKLADFSVEIESVTATTGPVVTLYELVPASGVKISRIESLQDDIALALKAKGIRIIAPMPGKGTVGVEIPNHNPKIVGLRSLVASAQFRESKAALPIALGKTINGENYVDDLSRMPHLLIAGATGSGKSVGINTIINSLLYRLHPSDVKFAIIDPKKIELTAYKKLRHHFLAICPDVDEEIITTPTNAVLLLKSVELEMEDRYNRLAAAGVRNIADYNERVKAGKLHDTETIHHSKMPYLILIVDELADLMITAAREVEEPIARLAQLARAVGIHLALATQRPSVDVITGVIKANFPARIAYQVSSKVDSRTILDMNGAEQLLGNGDMLYLPAGSPKPIRLQNPFISSEEVERIMEYIGSQQGYPAPMQLPSVLAKKKGTNGYSNDSRDELFEEAAHIVVRHQQGSVSLLQRRLKIGYSRAARLVDELEAVGIVGAFDGSKAREVLVETEAELETILKNLL